MSIKAKSTYISNNNLRQTNPKVVKDIQKKKRQSKRSGYMMFYMRYIRAENDKTDLRTRIEKLTEESQRPCSDCAKIKDEKDDYFKRNVKLAM